VPIGAEGQIEEMFDLGGGPRPWKAAWVINLQKAGCFPFLALLMWYYADKTPWATSTAAWTYLALHGSYGLVWLAKFVIFDRVVFKPDERAVAV